VRESTERESTTQQARHSERDTVRETQCKSIVVDSTVRERASTEIQSTVRESTVLESHREKDTVRESTVIKREKQTDTVKVTHWERAQ
jgi:hypothetical protein